MTTTKYLNYLEVWNNLLCNPADKYLIFCTSMDEDAVLFANEIMNYSTH